MRTLLASLALAQVLAAAPQNCPKTQLNLLPGGGQVVGNTEQAAISGNGRYMVWSSDGAGITPTSSAGKLDVFRTDLVSGSIDHVSVAFGGGIADDDSHYPSIDSSGERVVFCSWASNLLSTPQTYWGIYLRDLNDGTTERLDIDLPLTSGMTYGGAGLYASISPCGRYVSFQGLTQMGLGLPFRTQIYLRDLTAGVTEAISVDENGVFGEYSSLRSRVVPGGRYVVFGSHTQDLLPGVNCCFLTEVLLKDRATGDLELISEAEIEGSVGSNGPHSDQPDISADGRYVVFRSNQNLLGQWTPGTNSVIYLRDRLTGSLEQIVTSAGPIEAPAISSDGSQVVYQAQDSPSSTSRPQVYLWSRATGSVRTLSLNANGSVSSANSFTSATGSPFTTDGRSVVFLSKSKNLTGVPDPNGYTDVYKDECPLVGAATYCVAEVNSLGCTPSIGANGTPSASAGTGFVVTCDDALSQRLGLFYYGVVGTNLQPFQGGLRCVAAPVRRTPLVSSGGSQSQDCSGLFSIDFNAWIATGADPSLVPSQRVWGQWWSRDAASSFGTNLSDAIVFDVAP